MTRRSICTPERVSTLDFVSPFAITPLTMPVDVKASMIAMASRSRAAMSRSRSPMVSAIRRSEPAYAIRRTSERSPRRSR
jgi:hypothetical protein